MDYARLAEIYDAIRLMTAKVSDLDTRIGIIDSQTATWHEILKRIRVDLRALMRADTVGLRAYRDMLAEVEAVKSTIGVNRMNRSVALKERAMLLDNLEAARSDYDAGVKEMQEPPKNVLEFKS